MYAPSSPVFSVFANIWAALFLQNPEEAEEGGFKTQVFTQSWCINTSLYSKKRVYKHKILTSVQKLCPCGNKLQTQKHEEMQKKKTVKTIN